MSLFLYNNEKHATFCIYLFVNSLFLFSTCLFFLTFTRFFHLSSLGHLGTIVWQFFFFLLLIIIFSLCLFSRSLNEITNIRQVRKTSILSFVLVVRRSSSDG